MILYSADDSINGVIDQHKTRIILSHDGQNKWYIPAILTSGCSIDIRYFPFDYQKCVLKFGSWSYLSTALDLNVTRDDVDLSFYQESSEFWLVSTSAVRNSVKYRWFFRFIPWFILNLFTTLQHVYVNSFIWKIFSLDPKNESFVKVLLSPSSHSFSMHHGLINPTSIFWRTSALKDGSNFFGCDKSKKSQTRY